MKRNDSNLEEVARDTSSVSAQNSDHNVDINGSARAQSGTRSLDQHKNEQEKVCMFYNILYSRKV